MVSYSSLSSLNLYLYLTNKNMLRPLLSLTISLMILTSASAQQVIPLYEGKIPNAIDAANIESSDTSKADGKVRVREVSVPTLTVFLPAREKATGAAVIICPGGGYGLLAISHEGYDVAKELNKMGVAALVLKYRLPSDRIMKDKETGPLQDAQEAIRLTRKNAAQWNIDAGKVGIMGFSAGGHLAATAGTLFKNPVRKELIGTNLRPDFIILAYPVISFSDSLGHRGSRNNLLGNTPSAEKKILYSAERQVTADTPPTFLVHAQDDQGVKAGNSIKLYEALTTNKIPSELHIYPKGGHGFGMNNPTTKDLWMGRLENWLKGLF
jgi:acetyl esterase/lipase